MTYSVPLRGKAFTAEGVQLVDRQEAQGGRVLSVRLSRPDARRRSGLSNRRGQQRGSGSGPDPCDVSASLRSHDAHAEAAAAGALGSPTAGVVSGRV